MTHAQRWYDGCVRPWEYCLQVKYWITQIFIPNSVTVGKVTDGMGNKTSHMVAVFLPLNPTLPLTSTMVFKSEPLTLIPQTGLTRFLFSNPYAVPDTKPIFIDTESDRTITYGQLRSMVMRLNAGLRRHGMKKGETLCIFSPNQV